MHRIRLQSLHSSPDMVPACRPCLHASAHYAPRDWSQQQRNGASEGGFILTGTGWTPAVGWSHQPRIPTVPAVEILVDFNDLTIGRLVVGPLQNNVYVVTNSGDSVIIDAAADGNQILEAVAGLRVGAVLTTHGHHDHVGAARKVSKSLHIPFRLHPDDSGIAGIEPDSPLHHDQVIGLGTRMIRVLHTPGHTPGSVCFQIGNHLFSGDTLFPGGPGATRFPYSDFDQIMASLDEHLFVLDDATVVYPGHGAPTTIGTERPHVDEWRTRRW